jgi:hypothetical protein
VRTAIPEEVDLELRQNDRAAPKRRRDGGPHLTLASSKAGNAKRHMSLNDHLPDAGAAHLHTESWEEESLTKWSS